MARHELHDDGRDRRARLRAPEAHGLVLGRWRPSVPSRLFGVVFLGAFLVMGTLFVTAGAAAAIREAGAVGKVKIVSFDTDKGTLDLIKEGVISGSIAQGTWNRGYWSMHFLYNVKHNLVKPVEGWRTKGINPLPGVVDTGTNVVTKTNVEAFYTK